MSNLQRLRGGQHLNDHWDFDHPFERLLVDTAVAPDPQRVTGRLPALRDRWRVDTAVAPDPQRMSLGQPRVGEHTHRRLVGGPARPVPSRPVPRATSPRRVENDSAP